MTELINLEESSLNLSEFIKEAEKKPQQVNYHILLNDLYFWGPPITIVPVSESIKEFIIKEWENL